MSSCDLVLQVLLLRCSCSAGAAVVEPGLAIVASVALVGVTALLSPAFAGGGDSSAGENSAGDEVAEVTVTRSFSAPFTLPDGSEYTLEGITSTSDPYPISVGETQTKVESVGWVGGPRRSSSGTGVCELRMTGTCTPGVTDDPHDR